MAIGPGCHGKTGHGFIITVQCLLGMLHSASHWPPMLSHVCSPAGVINSWRKELGVSAACLPPPLSVCPSILCGIPPLLLPVVRFMTGVVEGLGTSPDCHMFGYELCQGHPIVWGFALFRLPSSCGFCSCCQHHFGPLHASSDLGDSTRAVCPQFQIASLQQEDVYKL